MAMLAAPTGSPPIAWLGAVLGLRSAIGLWGIGALADAAGFRVDSALPVSTVALPRAGSGGVDPGSLLGLPRPSCIIHAPVAARPTSMTSTSTIHPSLRRLRTMLAS